jgi:integrase
VSWPSSSTDTADTVFSGTPANGRNYRNCSGRPKSLVTRWPIRPGFGEPDGIRQTLSVVRSVRRFDGRRCFCDTKRSRSRRPIKLQRWIVALFRDLQAKACASNLCPEAHGLVFGTLLGQPINADYLVKHFRSILDVAGLPRIRLYDLRHSAATIALSAGVSPKVVSEQLGHASTAFTLDTYAHVLPHMQGEAVARVEAILLGATA